MTPEEQKEYEDWVNSRPPAMQEFIRKYPPDRQYRVKNGAPYSLTCPGSLVQIYGYNSDGSIVITLHANNKLPETILHEKMLGAQHNRSAEDISALHKQDVTTEIDPRWLEEYAGPPANLN